MALSDDPPIKITAPEYRPVGQGALETWLRKEAEEARGRGKLENNEDGQLEASELFDDPDGRRDGANIDGRWGEQPHMANGRQEPFHQNNATYSESKRDRQSLVERAFGRFNEAQRSEQALLSANFDHARAGDFTAHSVLLQSKTKEGSAKSLSERVRGVLDRF